MVTMSLEKNIRIRSDDENLKAVFPSPRKMNWPKRWLNQGSLISPISLPGWCAPKNCPDRSMNTWCVSESFKLA